jgi:hypothetical protein
MSIFEDIWNQKIGYNKNYWWSGSKISINSNYRDEEGKEYCLEKKLVQLQSNGQKPTFVLPHSQTSLCPPAQKELLWDWQKLSIFEKINLII